MKRLLIALALFLSLGASLALADNGSLAAQNSVVADSDDDGVVSATPSPSASPSASPRIMVPRHPVKKFFVCTLEYEPFKCPDGKVYANKCFARNAGGWEPEEDCTRLIGDAGFGSSVTAELREQIAERERLREEFKEKIEDEVKDDSRYRRCSQFSDASQKEACIKTETGIGELAREKNRCLGGDNESRCLGGLKDKIRDAWRFRFESVIDIAEKLERKGVSNETIAAFVAFVKEQALAFESSNSTAEKKEFVKNVAAEWKEFRKKALNEILESGIATASQRLQKALDALKQVRDKLQARNLTTLGLDNAISKLEENLDRLNSENATLREKWVLSHESIERLKHAKNAAVRIMNRMNVEDFVQPSVAVPSEVEDAEEAEG